MIIGTGIWMAKNHEKLYRRRLLRQNPKGMFIINVSKLANNSEVVICIL